MNANSEPSNFQDALRTAIRENWKWFVFQGIVMLILGCLAVAEPVIASVAVDIYVGWLFLFSGLLGLVTMFSARDASAFFWMLLTAALSLAVGIMLIWKPAEEDRFTDARTDGILYCRRRLPDRSDAILSRCHAQFMGLAARERNSPISCLQGLSSTPGPRVRVGRSASSWVST